MLTPMIELLFNHNVNIINKFKIYKLIKEYFKNDKKQTFTYYKAHIIFNKLLQTKILTPTNEKNSYKFNKVRENKPVVIYFD